jgi:hypothetical protein
MWTASWAAVLRFAFISRQASRRHPRSGKGPRTAGPRGKRNDSSNRRPRGPARHRLRNPHWPGVSRGGCARRGRGAGCLSRASEGNRVGGARRGASKAQRSRSLFAHGNGNKRLTGDFCQWLQPPVRRCSPKSTVRLRPSCTNRTPPATWAARFGKLYTEPKSVALPNPVDTSALRVLFPEYCLTPTNRLGNWKAYRNTKV